ncbi:MAG: hypothetical protein U0640_08870 [Phycisphaerales bacterium]
MELYSSPKEREQIAIENGGVVKPKTSWIALTAIAAFVVLVIYSISAALGHV